MPDSGMRSGELPRDRAGNDRADGAVQRHRFRFSLRELLLLLVVVGAALAIHRNFWDKTGAGDFYYMLGYFMAITSIGTVRGCGWWSRSRGPWLVLGLYGWAFMAAALYRIPSGQAQWDNPALGMSIGVVAALFSHVLFSVIDGDSPETQ